MATLYELDERLSVLENYMVDEETGEVVSEEDFYKLFDEIQMALNDKIENTMTFYKNLMSDVEAFKVEKSNLEKRMKVKENLANRLKKRIDEYIVYQFTDENGNVNNEKLKAYKFETPKVKLSYRKSEQVNVLDVDKLPKEYVKEEITISPKKTDIKNAIKNGKTIEGAEIVTNYNMQVK